MLEGAEGVEYISASLHGGGLCWAVIPGKEQKCSLIGEFSLFTIVDKNHPLPAKVTYNTAQTILHTISPIGKSLDIDMDQYPKTFDVEIEVAHPNP